MMERLGWGEEGGRRGLNGGKEMWGERRGGEGMGGRGTLNIGRELFFSFLPFSFDGREGFSILE